MASPEQEERERTGGLSPDAIIAEKQRLGVPAGGQALRAWIQYKLKSLRNAKTGRPWNQADIARETHASESTVSIIYTGGRDHGHKSGRVRRLTAELLEIPEAVLFPAQSDGVPSEGG